MGRAGLSPEHIRLGDPGNTSSKLVSPDLRRAEKPFGLRDSLFRTPQELKRIVFPILVSLGAGGPWAFYLLHARDAPARYFLFCSLLRVSLW